MTWVDSLGDDEVRARLVNRGWPLAVARIYVAHRHQPWAAHRIAWTLNR